MTRTTVLFNGDKMKNHVCSSRNESKNLWKPKAFIKSVRAFIKSVRFNFLDSFLDEQNNLYSQSYNQSRLPVYHSDRTPPPNKGLLKLGLFPLLSALQQESSFIYVPKLLRKMRYWWLRISSTELTCTCQILWQAAGTKNHLETLDPLRM